MRYKTKLIFTIFLFPLLIFTFAYIAFTTTFSIKEERDNIQIEKIKLVDATNSISVTNPEVEHNKIKFNISFLKENDYVEYEITIKNNHKELVEIKDIIIDENFTTPEQLSYNISYEPSNKIVSNNTSVVKIRISSSVVTTGSVDLRFIL